MERYPSEGAIPLARDLERSLPSVKSKAHKLGLVYDPALAPTDGRVCTKCGLWKNADAFEKKATYRGGLYSWCKDCSSNYRKARWHDRPDVRERCHESHRRARLEMLKVYGGDPPRCACCGEGHPEFLALDHEQGGGNAHRRAVGAGSTGVMYALKRAGWPSGYRVLCHNCNMAIGFYGHCPHLSVSKSG